MIRDQRNKAQNAGYGFKNLFNRIPVFCLDSLTALFLSAFCSLILISVATQAEASLNIKREVIGNGLTLLIVERHHLPIVKVSVGIKAGSLREPAEKSGLANLVAELLTHGTKSRTAADINDEVEFIGASLSGSGGDDFITVNLSVLKKDIELGFDLLSDVIINPLFPAIEMDKKKERIKARLKAQEEEPGFVASREFKKAVFGTHPYGRLISGSEETLNAIKMSDLVKFHQKYYVPNKAIMSVVGDVTAGEVKDLLRKYFSVWKLKEIADEPAEDLTIERGRETILVDKDLTQATIMLGHVGIKRADPDYYAVSVMNYILGGGGFASRLMQNIREEKGLVYDVRSFFSADKYSGSFRISLQTKNESANTAIEEILKELKKIMEDSVNDMELADAKAFLTGSFPMRIETSQRIASFLVAVEYYEVGIDYIDKYPEHINKVSKEDVLRVANEHLDTEKFVLVIVADQKETSLKKEFQWLPVEKYNQ
jgi:zinc protease